MNYIGNAQFTNLDGFLIWYESLTLEQAKAVNNTVEKVFPYPSSVRRTDSDLYFIRSRADAMYCVSCWASYPPEQTPEFKWPAQRKAMAAEIREFVQISTLYNTPIRVGLWADGLAYIYLGNPQKGFVIPEPEKHLTYTPKADYGSLTPAQVRASLNVPQGAETQNIIPLEWESALSANDVREQKAIQEQAIDMVNQQIEDIRECKTGELAILQAEIEAKQKELEQKKSDMMQQLNEKLEELESMKYSMENQIFMLEAQIYSIRCFAGETVQFTQITSGKNASDTEPIVVHQKLHFLDEDLGRLASIYTIRWEDTSLFEEFLKHSPLALDTFAPNQRCISLVRMSKDGKKVAEDHDIPYRNLLEKYDYYHGKTIGIIIRNGENLYLGWTDQEKIDIEDDLIISRIITETEPAPAQEFLFESDRQNWIKQQRKERRQLMEGLASRSFVYNIVEGVVERTPILPLPHGVTLAKQSEYVVYAVADKWVTDNKYGSFNEIVDRCNKQITKGDIILTVQSLHPEWRKSFPRRNENSRGRGYANRTHDVSADDCTLYPVNLIELDDPISWTHYKLHASDKDFFYKTRTENVDSLSPDCVIGDTWIEQHRHIFVSLEKVYSEFGARSNFEVYPSEFINLQYMNSVWIEWAITTKTLGGWTIGGKAVNYAYAIRYMKKALDYVRDREKKERELLDSIDLSICTDPDWPVKLSEWKLDKGVREITSYQAKRFAKALKKSE